MYSGRLGLLALVAACATAAEPAPTALGIGRPLSAAEISGLDITVLPDGSGLPRGRASARDGAPIYAARCAACHGDQGQGLGGFPALVGGVGTLTGTEPALTVGSYWPLATTLFDYIRRAMPYQAAGELSSDEVYALTAWILFKNGILRESSLLDRKKLARIRMPNANGFVPDPRPDVSPQK